MKLEQINYTPLQGMNTAWSKVMRETFKLPPAVTIGIAVGFGAIAFYYLQMLALLLIGGVISVISAKVQTRKNIVWKDFAVANGWYVTPIMGSSTSFVPPSIAHRGRGQKFSLVVHGGVDEHECDILMYQFTTGSGKSKRTHYYTIVRVQLGRPFPHLLIDSKHTWAIYDRGGAVHPVKLEGDFNKYFSLYINKNEHIDALSVVTPDVMRTLIDANQTHDIEIIDTYLYFMAHSDHRNADALPKLLKSVDLLSDQLAHKAKTIHYVPQGQALHSDRLAAATAQYFRSGDRVASSLVQAVSLLVFILIGLFLLIGFFGNLFAI